MPNFERLLRPLSAIKQKYLRSRELAGTKQEAKNEQIRIAMEQEDAKELERRNEEFEMRMSNNGPPPPGWSGWDQRNDLLGWDTEYLKRVRRR